MLHLTPEMGSTGEEDRLKILLFCIFRLVVVVKDVS